MNVESSQVDWTEGRELAPIIFDGPEQLEQAVDKACAVLRRADADRLRVLGDSYEQQALRESPFSFTAGELGGIAGGLRIAAALLENEAAA